MEQTKFTRFKRIVNKKLLSILIVLMFLFGSLYFLTCNSTPIKHKTTPIEYVSPQQNVTKIDTIQIKDSIQNELIDEVSKYVKKQAPNSHQFIPKYLVQAGLNNNIDICFMMAQTQIETCYGTTGAGRESSRRSMFGVIKRKYSNYDEAINHYCDVLKKYYLVKGRTEKHLLTKYVTGSGGRYAANPNYETELRVAYNHIKRTTNVYSLQQEWNKF
jgi:flagellum-specific peptidoglycan hydrolase FlgJ